MPVYAFRCADHGDLETNHPMGSAPGTTPCPECGLPARRVFHAPRLSLGSSTRRALIDRTERTRDEPEVVPAPPGRARGRSLAGNPALSRLPRP